MMKYIIATHGNLADALKSTMEMIVGPHAEIQALGLQPDMSIEDYRKRLVECIGNDQTLVFLDIVGGTPFNSLIQELKSDNVSFISGTNLGMLLEIVLNTEIKDLKDASAFAKEKGIQSIVTKDDILSQ